MHIPIIEPEFTSDTEYTILKIILTFFWINVIESPKDYENLFFMYFPRKRPTNNKNDRISRFVMKPEWIHANTEAYIYSYK